MSAKRITVTVPADMYDLLQERKRREGIPISTQVQRAIAADIIERVATKHAPARQTVEEFLRGKVLVDTPESYNAQAGE